MKKNIFSFALFVFICCFAYSAEEININTTVKVYDRNLQEITSRFTYYPEETEVGNDALILYFGAGYSSRAFMFAYNLRQRFIEIIDKCIEWANIARLNNVRQLTREVTAGIGIIGVTSRIEPYSADFTFSIREVQDRVEMTLIINYKTTYELNARSQGNYIVFKEHDFIELKELFSENFLSQYADRAREQRMVEELFQ